MTSYAYSWFRFYMTILLVVSIFAYYNSCKLAAHHLGDVCTTGAGHAHISWCTSAQQLLCDWRSCIFQQLIFNLRRTFPICFKDLSYMLQCFCANSAIVPLGFVYFPFGTMAQWHKWHKLTYSLTPTTLPSLPTCQTWGEGEEGLAGEQGGSSDAGEYSFHPLLVK